MFAFQNFIAYHKARELYLSLQKIIKLQSLNPSTRDQLQRGSMSIVLNIAEGSGRISLKDRRRFFNIARSSLFECVAILDLLRESSISEGDYYDYFSLADETSRILYSIINKADVKQWDFR